MYPSIKLIFIVPNSRGFIVKLTIICIILCRFLGSVCSNRTNSRCSSSPKGVALRNARSRAQLANYNRPTLLRPSPLRWTCRALNLETCGSLREFRPWLSPDPGLPPARTDADSPLPGPSSPVGPTWTSKLAHRFGPILPMIIPKESETWENSPYPSALWWVDRG